MSFIKELAEKQGKELCIEYNEKTGEVVIEADVHIKPFKRFNKILQKHGNDNYFMETRYSGRGTFLNRGRPVISYFSPPPERIVKFEGNFSGAGLTIRYDENKLTKKDIEILDFIMAEIGIHP